MFFNRKDPKTELEGIERAIEILNDRYEKKQVPIEVFRKKSFEFAKKKEKCLKKLAKAEKKEQ